MEFARLRRLAAVALAASVLIPPEVLRAGPPLCAFRAVTGRPCPSCGMTRSWNAMGHLQARTAAGYHLMGPITFAAAAAFVVVGERPLVGSPGGRARPFVVAVFSAGWIGAWLWRLARRDIG